MWLTNAILGMLCMGTMVLAMKKVTLYRVPHSWILMLVFSFGAFFYLIHSWSTRSTLNLTGQSLAWIFGIAVCSYAGNLFYLGSSGISVGFFIERGRGTDPSRPGGITRHV